MQGSERGSGVRGYIVSLALLITAWKVLSLAFSHPALPPPEVVLAALLGSADRLAVHAAFSLMRVVYALLLSFSLAFPVGILSREDRINKIVSPFLYLLYPIPHIVLLPLYILLFGIGDLSKVVLIATILFFQIAVTTRDAARQVSEYYVYSIMSLGASKFDIYRHVIVPASLPRIITALRISVGTAVAVLFFAESFATSTGLGYVIMDSWSRADYNTMYAAIAAMALLGFTLYIILEVVEVRVCRWV